MISQHFKTENPWYLKYKKILCTTWSLLLNLLNSNFYIHLVPTSPKRFLPRMRFLNYCHETKMKVITLGQPHGHDNDISVKGWKYLICLANDRKQL